jgi:hypothetical protein
LIRVEDLSLASPPAAEMDSSDNLETIERRTILSVMREVKGNKALRRRRCGDSAAECR